MSSSPAVPDPRHLRASDADRERIANVLRDAAGDGRLTMAELDERLDAVYAAKTYAELEPITHDLPATGAAYAPAVSPGADQDPARFGGQATSAAAVAILGGFSRKGDWVVPKTFNAFMFMGGGEIDMREARFEDREVSIHIVAILGGCEIIVPDDATVRVTGIGIMGAFEHTVSGAETPGGPLITISGLAFMGGVDVKRKPTIEAQREARRLRHEERRLRHEVQRESRDTRRAGELE
jgi:Domain of unknown function (DUF1707)/Cell wall-active antibiotics response 4TMS YvqF